MIGIVDYGLGNVKAFENIYRQLGIDAAPVRTPDELALADRLILPGVGAFDWAMDRLNRSGMVEMLNHRVLEDRVPVLGVCVGMQMMADSSAEGSMPGLGWISGSVLRFKDEWFGQKTHLPHMGWNQVVSRQDDKLFAGINDPQFYFLHSYFYKTAEPSHSIATAYYGIEFTAAVRRENIVATQFHPEKSHGWGMAVLKNFSETH